MYTPERERETSERLRRRKEAGCRSSRVTTASDTLKHWWIQSNSIIHLNLSELRIQRLAVLRHSCIVQWPCGVYNAVISLYQSLRQDVLCVCKTLLPICTSMASAVCSTANTSSHTHTHHPEKLMKAMCVCVWAVSVRTPTLHHWHTYKKQPTVLGKIRRSQELGHSSCPLLLDV